MPKRLIVLGLLVLVIAGMGMISAISGSWAWSVATGCSIALWLAVSAVAPKRAHDHKDAPQSER